MTYSRHWHGSISVPQKWSPCEVLVPLCGPALDPGSVPAVIREGKGSVKELHEGKFTVSAAKTDEMEYVAPSGNKTNTAWQTLTSGVGLA